MAEQEVKTKKLVFQDIDMFQNSILNPKSIENGNKTKISLTSSSISSEADSVSIKNSNDNYISLENSTVDIKTSQAKVTGAVNINDNKVSVNDEDCTISGINVNINDTSKNVSIVGQHNLSIKSTLGNSSQYSEITSSYVRAVEEASSNQFLVKEKVCITWDDRTESLLFIQR